MKTAKQPQSYADIITAIRTTTERSQMYAGMEQLLETLYKQHTPEDIHAIETQMPPTAARVLAKQLTTAPLQNSSADQRTLLEHIQEALENLHVLSIEIAFEPTEETIAVLTNWIRKYLGNGIIVEMSIDRTLIAGVRISFQGRYKEINLARLIETTLAQKKAAVHSLLNK